MNAKFKADKTDKKISKKEIFKRLYSYIKPYKKAFFLSMILIVVSSFLSSLGPLFLGKATDQLYNIYVDGMGIKSAYEVFLNTVYIMSCIYMSGFVIKYISSKILLNVTQSTLFDIRNNVDAKLKKLPLKYIDNNEFGDILSRITNDVDTISNSLQQSLEQLVSSLTTVIFILIMMFWISPILTLVSLCSIPLTSLATVKLMKISQKYFDKQQQAIGKINGYVEEMYTGHNVVSAFGMEDETRKEFDKRNDELYSSGRKAQFLSGSMMPLAQGIGDFGYVAVVFVGAIMVIGKTASIGTIQSFIHYLRQFSQPVMQSAQIAGMMQATASAADRVFEFLDEEEEVSDENLTAKIDSNNLYVSFEDVKFGYSNDNILMKNINFKVEAGNTVAIVGSTGAGKTTLVNLILRFYDIFDGQIKIGGVDIRDVKRSELRKLFGMVLQDSWIFKGSIMDNIRYGRLDATDEEVIYAAKIASADDFIKKLPKGYNFNLSEDGNNISQGERQLITIARAILANTPIMILDEATSSVDTRTEVLIQRAMKKLMENKMSFVIAHRLSTIRNADCIMYMEDGDIKEIGNHDELIALDGSYAKLYKSQFEAEDNSI